jgi:hypothetical protein
MKKIFFGATSLVFLMAGVAKAQYEGYPALFGRQLFNGGTARYMAIGGAGTSLGADMSAAYVNPAGLGMYRKSEFSFSPIIGASGTNSSYLGESDRDSKGSFGIANLGIAICSNKDDLDKSDWRGGTFSITMNKTNSFQNRVSFSGTDNASMADYFAQLADGTPSTTLDAQDPNAAGISSLAGLAYWTYLINPTSPGGSQYVDGITDESFVKDATYTTKGSQSTWNVSYGGNYKDKLFIGGGLGITTISYKEDLSYTETTQLGPSDTTNAFNTFTFNDYNTIKGTGVNFKLGYIYKASDVVRFGTTITTPTYYWMNQQYNSDLTVTYPSYITNSNGPLGTQSQSTSVGYFKFNYTTPVKVASGISLFAGKSGFVSADFEYIPYQLSDLSGRSSADEKYLQSYNKIVSNTYKNVINLRLGGELRLDIFRLRAGLGYLPNPYNYTDKVNRDVAQFSGGAGVRLNDVYFDIGVVNSRFQSSYTPYTLPYNDPTIPPVSTTITKNSMMNVVLTMGFYFE